MDLTLPLLLFCAVMVGLGVWDVVKARLTDLLRGVAIFEGTLLAAGVAVLLLPPAAGGAILFVTAPAVFAVAWSEVGRVLEGRREQAERYLEGDAAAAEKLLALHDRLDGLRSRPARWKNAVAGALGSGLVISVAVATGSWILLVPGVAAAGYPFLQLARILTEGFEGPWLEREIERLTGERPRRGSLPPGGDEPRRDQRNSPPVTRPASSGEEPPGP